MHRETISRPPSHGFKKERPLDPAMAVNDLKLATALVNALEDLKVLVKSPEDLLKCSETQLWTLIAEPFLIEAHRSAASWTDLQASMPEWFSNASRMEMLLFLATSLQQERLVAERSSKPSATTSSSSETTSLRPLKLPAQLSEDQRTMVNDCYRLMAGDYQRRRVGMRQRLDVLQTTFANTVAEPATTTTARQQPTMSLDELLQHYRQPHSSSTWSSTTTKRIQQHQASVSIPSTSNGGGRLNTTESRLSMPEWSSSNS